MASTDVYVQPDAPDPVLSERTVLELARLHVPSAEAVTGIDESGGEARVYVVDRDLVVKTQRPPRRRPRTDLAKEALLLAQLADRLPGQIPVLLGYGRVETAEGAVEYLCMTRVQGRAALHLSSPVTPEVLRRLGEVLAVVHATEFDAAPALIPADRDVSDVRVRLERAFAVAAERLARRPEARGFPPAHAGRAGESPSASAPGRGVIPAPTRDAPGVRRDSTPERGPPGPPTGRRPL